MLDWSLWFAVAGLISPAVVVIGIALREGQGDGTR